VGRDRGKMKKIKIFYNPLTPYFTIIYLFSVFSVSSVANEIFESNVHVGERIERANVSSH
jgi:hypothetical protein